MGFEVEVRAGGVAAAADMSKGLARGDWLSFRDEGAPYEVAVASNGRIGTYHLQEPAAAEHVDGVAVHVTRKGRAVAEARVADHPEDPSGRGRLNGGAFGRDDVDAVMAGTTAGPEPGHDRPAERVVQPPEITHNALADAGSVTSPAVAVGAASSRSELVRGVLI